MILLVFLFLIQRRVTCWGQDCMFRRKHSTETEKWMFIQLRLSWLDCVHCNCNLSNTFSFFVFSLDKDKRLGEPMVRCTWPEYHTIQWHIKHNKMHITDAASSKNQHQVQTEPWRCCLTRYIEHLYSLNIKPSTSPLIITVFANSISVEATPIDYTSIVAKEGTNYLQERMQKKIH